jgi:hypothetical protein
MTETVRSGDRDLHLHGITGREYGAPYHYIDFSARPLAGGAGLEVTIDGIRYEPSPLHYVQGGAELSLPIDDLISGDPVPLTVRYLDRSDRYQAMITDTTVSVEPIADPTFTEFADPVWRRVPRRLFWYYAVRWSTSAGALGEAEPELTQPLDDFLLGAGCTRWQLTAGHYKSLLLEVDEQGAASMDDLSNPHLAPHRVSTFRYDGDLAALLSQVKAFRPPDSAPLWIFYIGDETGFLGLP